MLIVEVFCKGDVTVFDKYTSPAFVEHQYGFIPPNVESVKIAIQNLHKAFPDFSMTIEDLVVNDDKVWGRMTGRGTHKNQFGPLPPSSWES